MEKSNVLIATGGTGGHIFPALVLGNYLKSKGYEILLTADIRSENILGKNAGNLNYKLIKSGCKLTSLSSIKNILSGIRQSSKIVNNFKPSVVIGFGSYATLPPLLVSRHKKIPFCLHEQNSYIGRINRFFLKDAKYLFTSFQEMYGININYSEKIVFTGNPLRDEVKKFKNDSFSYPNEKENFNILIVGGSGGATFFSTSLKEAFSFLDKKFKARLEVIHQVKEERELDQVREFYSRQNIKARVSRFFDNLPELIDKSHLIIARSGVGTMSEIAAIGRPTIFIPSPNVINNHQYYNATFYKRSNACLVVEEKNFIAADFARTLSLLLEDRNKLETLATNMKKLAVLDAEETVERQIRQIGENGDGVLA